MRPNDKEIISAISEEPERGFRLLMSDYKEAVYWHIRRLVVSHADAQDATQETFIRIFRSLHRFRGESSLASWIYRIATNEALRSIERHKSDRVSLSGADTETRTLGNIATDEYVNFDDLEAVRLQKAILSLPTKQQLVFNLRYYDELSYDEIAKITDSTADNVKANYHIAKNKIIDFMNSTD